LQRNDLALLCTTGSEMPPLMATEFLVRCADIFAEYFEVCSAAAIRSHFVTVYQLLEEMVDSGMPTNTESNILKEMIPPPSVVGRISSVMGGSAGVIAAAVLPGGGGASAVPWRRADCRYSNNEIFFDVVEAVDATLDAEGRLLSGGIYGELHATARLSGMPDLTLSFSNSGLLDDVRFHPCVRYARFAADRVLSFVPPDGPCKLMSYKLREPPSGGPGGRGPPGMMGAMPMLPLPLYVKPQFSFSESSGRISLMVGPRLDLRKPVEAIVIRVPLPVCVASIDVQANHGGVGYDEKAKVIMWDIGVIPKDRTPILSGVLQLDRSRGGAGTGGADGGGSAGGGGGGGAGGDDDAYSKSKMLWEEALCIEASFKVYGANVSGVAVDALHLVNETYKLYKGVRYTTMSGRFVVRV
jgi:AP-3 complex subunit mu